MRKEELDPLSAREESEIFADLERLCTSDGFIHAIAYFCWRDNIISFSGSEISERDIEHQYSHEKLLRTEISTLIGLMVKSEISFEIPSPDTMQYFINASEALLHEMHMSLQKPWMAAFEARARESGSAKNTNPFSNAEALREPIFYGGESAYDFQYRDLARLKYKNDNSWLESHLGFTIDEACEIAQVLSVMQVKKIKSIYSELKSIPPDKWTLLPGFIFSIDELAQSTNITKTKIRKIIDAFCFGENGANDEFISLSAFNEANVTPIIRNNNGSYILFQPYSLLEALYEAPFFWMLSDKNYASVASDNRGEFTENFIFERLVKVFGKKNVFRNVNIYKGKNRFAEADVLVLYGDRVIVVQAKSKRLTVEARKGNDLQLKTDFKKAILDAYHQALLCSKAILSSEYRLVSSTGEEISLNVIPIKILPICAVSDHYPALAAQVRLFLNVETTNVIQSPLVTDVFFIDVLTELLNTPLNILNYIELRAKFYKKILVSHELAILGYHLKYNLWLEEEHDLVNLGDDFASALDIAMLARRSGTPGKKTPDGILTRFSDTPIGYLLAEIEASALPDLVGLGMIFLQLSSEAAKHINKGIERFVKLAAEDGQIHDMSIPSEAEKAGFTIHISGQPEDVAREHLYRHCELRKYDTKSDAWYGVLLAPGSGKMRGALVIKNKWNADERMEAALAAIPRKSMVPLASLSKRVRRKKIGRNDPCPCGSGKKYKKCCRNKEKN